MRKLSIILLVGLFTLSCGLFGSKEYESKEYISTTGNAAPGTETKIELEDGAAIVIPANAIDGDVSVKVERNPEKSNNFPPLDENLLAVGDFYNFEIDGTINGPVDLVLPFDPEMVPENDAGVLVAAIPTENGWKYIPVIPDGNKVTLYTDQVGDPLIAWHFACTDRTDLSYEGQPENPCEEENAKKLVCDTEIPLEVIQNGDQFEVTGSVIPVAKNFFGSTVSEPAANITVTLNLNLREVGSENKVSVQTDENGSFSYQLDTSQLKDGWNWVFAKVECDPWWGKIVVESNGYAEFNYVPPVAEQPASTAVPDPTQTPIAEQPVETPVPAGAVLLPDFVGQDIDDAIEWLETNGFKYTWIDGSSPYDLGVVFKQAPSGGQYKVPHRTAVVLYRTTEQIEDEYGCLTIDLTPEEKANCGRHYFEIISISVEDVIHTTRQITGSCNASQWQEDESFTARFTFSEQQVKRCEDCNVFTKVDENTYEFEDPNPSLYSSVGKKRTTRYYFVSNGYIQEYTYIDEYHDGLQGCKFTIIYSRSD